LGPNHNRVLFEYFLVIVIETDVEVGVFDAKLQLFLQQFT